MAQAAVSRADLLLAVQIAGADVQAQERLAGVLGFHKAMPAPTLPPPLAVLGAVEKTSTAGPREHPVDRPGGARLPLLAAHFGLIDVEDLVGPPEGDGVAPPELRAEHCLPRQRRGGPRHQPLVRPARLWPALRRSVSSLRPAGVDLPSLMQSMALGHAVNHLPRCQFAAWADRLWVVRDVGDAMRPYQRDVDLIVGQLQRQRGKAGLTIWTVRDLPEQVLACSAMQPPGHGLPRLDRPPAGTHVLMLSHLGGLARHPVVRQRWQVLAQRQQRQGALPVAWVPHSALWVDAELAAVVQVHCLHPRGNLRAQHGTRLPQAGQVAGRTAWLVDRLLTLAACCVHLRPGLLRALRLLDPSLSAEPGLEGLAWTHPRYTGRGDISRALSADGIDQLRPGFENLDSALQARIWLVMRQAHQWNGRFTDAAEVLIWHSHADPAAQPPSIDAALQEAKDLFGAFLATVGSAHPDPAAVAYASDLLYRQGADARWLRANAKLMARMQAISGSNVVPAGLDPADVMRARHGPGRSRPSEARLYQRGDELWLCPADQPPSPGISAVGPPFKAGEISVALGDGPARILQVGDAAQPLGPLLPEARVLTVWADDKLLRVGPVPRPGWALEWGRDAQGLYGLAPSATGPTQRLYWAPEADQPSFRRLRRTPEHDIGQGAKLALGGDLHHGLYTELWVKQGLAQTFRWIPPGEFWMGSPDDEPERYDDEGPRHRVRLSQGFWLADSACTQALWQALMGNNPSDFKGDDQRPVENVSFDDVQQFLARLQALLPPGCHAVLPTEAQWEYACRAGSDTPFNLPAPISRASANFDASVRSALALKGEASQATVPVKSLPANAWGLHEMHGNVWEWCADDQRDYAGTALRDAALEDPWGPVSQEPEARRAVRGGAWFDRASDLRSARRDRSPRVDRDRVLGFRVALRSSPVGLAPEGPAAGLSPGPEAPGAPARRDAGPAPRGWVDRVRDLIQPRAAPATRPPGKKTPPKR